MIMDTTLVKVAIVMIIRHYYLSNVLIVIDIKILICIIAKGSRSNGVPDSTTNDDTVFILLILNY